ncbi:MAG: hypothetical protein J0J06_11065 [Sphingomonas sp.]|uniref:hypothetical protein n=1 Tax=Sphingomonas sp. TaxID=28214 RepID=UPI001AC8F672|nr:hypothetical protein [Sphingomonas sp.]MBN8815976.1 hypothetical protein [Sphingomonas sp.]
MSERVLLDNDVILKTASYALADETLAVTTVDEIPPAMLGVGRFVVRSRLARASNIADPARATAAFERMLTAMTLVEPDDAEMAAAADLEAEAIRRDLELDGGESQLLAMLANRACSLLVTGDKRAIAAMAIVAAAQAGSRVACLEQLIAHVVAVNGTAAVQPRICAEPNVDRAITSCFACSSPNPPGDADVLAGLASYTSHLNRSAPGVLLAGDDLRSAHA